MFLIFFKFVFRGQAFYHKYQSSLDFANFIGVVSVVAIETIMQTLACTGKSSTPAKAYKRYVENIMYHHYFHADSPEDPKSLCYRAIKSVRRKHKHGSMAAQRHNIGFINQRDMSLTLFSFIGFVMAKPEFFRVTESFKSLIHFWRVLGFVLGIEDRFNVFSGDEETVGLRSRAIIKHIFIPAIIHASPQYDEMTYAAMEGLRAMIPNINIERMRFLIKVVNGIPGYYVDEHQGQTQLEYLEKYPHYVGKDNQELLETISSGSGACKAFEGKDVLEKWAIQWNLILLKYVYTFNVSRQVMNFFSNLMFNFLLKYPIIAKSRFGEKFENVDNSIMENYLREK